MYEYNWNCKVIKAYNQFLLIPSAKRLNLTLASLCQLEAEHPTQPDQMAVNWLYALIKRSVRVQ